MTDELNSYNGLVANGYKHEYVKHKESQFSFGDMYTNGIVSIEHFREYRVMYYNLWKSTHCV